MDTIRPYGDLYQGRRAPAPMPDPGPQRLPSGESFIDFQRRVRPPDIDAATGAGFSASELADAREWRRLRLSGLLGRGVHIPNKYLAFVWDGAAPQGAPFSLEAASDPARSIAAQVDARLSMQARMATDTAPTRRLGTDEPRRPTMSYKLAQVLRGLPTPLTEGMFDREMKRLDVPVGAARLALKMEAEGWGLFQTRGAALPPPREHEPRTYHQAPQVADPAVQHFVHKDSKEAREHTAAHRKTMHATTGPAPAQRRTSGHIKTMQACDEHGYACYDGTGIDLL